MVEFALAEQLLVQLLALAKPGEDDLDMVSA
jgi:hypothetical protein